MKPRSKQEIFNYLVENPTKKVGTQLGYYVLGDAYKISGYSNFYKGQLILVEFRFGFYYFSQLNHWGTRWGSKKEDLSSFSQHDLDMGRQIRRNKTILVTKN